MNKKPNENYKWFLMILGALTNAFVVAAPVMALSVLMPEISSTLDLNLIQAGLVWGIGSLPMVFASLLAGNLSDRFGPKRVLTISCVLIGLAGASRGLASNFTLLMLTVFLSGFLGPLITLNNVRNAVIWFPSRQLGLANGLVTLGMAFGFFIGSMVSATYLSPALGGWSNVFLFYGALAMLFAIPWSLTRMAPQTLQPAGADPIRVSFRESMSHLLKLKEIWLLGLAFLGVSGGVSGLIGYLPLYLQDLGWTVSRTGGVLSAFNIASMAFVLPLTSWSDRLGSRSMILIGAAILTAIGIGLLPFAGGVAIWALMITIGATRDSYMGILFTRVIETRGVGSAYSAMAIGFSMVFIGVGNLVSPPLGNSLASEAMPGAPLFFWAALALFGALCVALASRQGLVKVNQRYESIE